MRDPLPWSQFLLALWPIWLVLGAVLVLSLLNWHAGRVTRRATVCQCAPCPGRGYDGHGMNHCAECCFGTGVEADMDCPVHGVAAYA